MLKQLLGVLRDAQTKYTKGDFDVWLSAYNSNGRPALVLADRDTGEAICTASVNIDAAPVNELLIKSYSENEGVRELLESRNVIGEAYAEYRTGFVTVTAHVLNKDSSTWINNKPGVSNNG